MSDFKSTDNERHCTMNSECKTHICLSSSEDWCGFDIRVYTERFTGRRRWASKEEIKARIKELGLPNTTRIDY